jgi:hypothetical protein
LIGGQQALSCLLDHQDGPLTPMESSKEGVLRTTYAVWIGKENAIVELWGEVARSQVGTFRWRFDPIIDAVRIP